jgi:hypothetical protein
MYKSFDYPSAWDAYSNYECSVLTQLIYQRLIDSGCEISLREFHNGSTDMVSYILESTGFMIGVTREVDRCSLSIHVYKEDWGMLKFLSVWKQFINEGIVWGGPFEKSAPTKREKEKSNKPKTPYRLTKDDIKYRKQKVKEAKIMRAEDPSRVWKDIAKELGIPERTLRDWRHNY